MRKAPSLLGEPVGKRNAEMINMSNLFAGGLLGGGSSAFMGDVAAIPRTPPLLEPAVGRLSRADSFTRGVDDEPNAESRRTKRRSKLSPSKKAAAAAAPIDWTAPREMACGGVTTRTNHLGQPVVKKSERVRVKYSRGITIVRSNGQLVSKMREREKAIWLLSDELRAHCNMTAAGMHELLAVGPNPRGQTSLRHSRLAH